LVNAAGGGVEAKTMTKRKFLTNCVLFNVAIWTLISNGRFLKPVWRKTTFKELARGDKFNGSPSGPYWVKIDSRRATHIQSGKIYGFNGNDFQVWNRAIQP
jgi:hypothetical protein